MSATTTASTDRTWAILSHLSGFLAYFTAVGHLIAPLVIWLVHRQESPEVEHHAREALNLQISFTLYYLVAGLLCFILIGFAILPVLLILHVVLMIIAAVKASEGARYRYPLTIRLVQ